VVNVVFTDGEVKKFMMSASNGIVHHLMNEAARTGVLVIRNDQTKQSLCIPLAQVRYVEVDTLDTGEVVEESKP
jgi:hypothetical protein